MNFGLALISDPDDTTRRFTSLQATAVSAGFVGLQDLTLQASNMLVHVNKGLTLAPQAEKIIKVNTELKLEIPLDLLGTLTLARAGSSAQVSIDDSTTTAKLLASLKAALEQLPGVGAGNVLVTGDRYSGFVIEFVAALAGVAVTGITVTAQGAPVSATVSTLEAAQAGSAEVKQLSLRALREEPAPVSVNISTPQAGQAGLTEINDIVFTAPTVPGAYDVFFMTEGVVQLENAAVAGLSEQQRLTLVGDTSTAPAAATAVVSQVQAGGAGSSAAYNILFKAEKVIQEYELRLMDGSAQKVRAVYRGDSAVAATIAEMRTAFATLYKGLTGGVANVANVEVSLDSSYTGKGDVARAGRQGWLSRFFQVISPF